MTGQPIEGVLSVTVKAPKATNADALATTLFVIGPEKGKEILSRLPGSEALFITLDPARPRSFHVSVTPRFQKILKRKSRPLRLPKKSGG